MKKISILYIEDKADQRKSLTKQLRSRGYRVTPSRSCETGLNLFRERRFDAILSDLHLPGMSGMDLLEEIHKIDPDFPFILLTAHGDVSQAVKAIKKGAHHFILKPPDINEIDITIRQTIEQVRIHRELSDSQAALRMIYENIPDIIYSMNPRGELTSISPSSEAVLGYKPAQYIGRSVMELIHPDDHEEVARALTESVTTGKPRVRVLQFRLISKSGEARHFEVSRKLVFENGKVVRLDGIARDITERKLLEERLKSYSADLERKNAEMQQLLRELTRKKDELHAIIDSSPDVIFLVNNDGVVQEVNSAVSRFFGLRPDEIIGDSFDAFNKRIKGHIADFKKFNHLLDHLKKRPDCTGDCAGPFDIDIFFGRGVELSGPVPAYFCPFSVSILDEKGKETGRVWIYNDITTMKRADEQLHTIVRASPIPTIISRIDDGKILYANENLARLVGLTAEELIGRFTPDFYYDPADRKIVVDSLRRDGFLRNFETRIKRVDGSVIWMIFSIVVTEFAGEPVMLAGLYDISKRKAAEQELERERNFVSAILDTAGALVIVLDRKGRIVRFNRACEEKTGYSFTEVQGRQFWDFLLLPEEKKPVQAVFEKLCRGDFPSSYENFWVTREGNHRLISWSNTALLDDAGDVEFVIGTGIDITEHREADEKMKLYRELFMNANDGIIITDADGCFIERNPAHRRNTGIPDEEIEGSNIAEILAEWGYDIRVPLKEEGSFRGEITGRHADGSLHTVDISVTPILSESGEVIRYAGIARDISALKRALNDLEEANRNLRDTQAQLVQSEKMASLGTLVAGVAHEINTPIGAVSSMQDTLFRTMGKLAETLESLVPPGSENRPKLEAMLKVIDDANQVIKPGTDRVIDIVRRLRSFARLDEADLKTVDIHEGLEDTLTLIHHELKHHVTVKKNYGKIPRIACFPGQLNQVFLNILVNARQAIKEKGEIRITTSLKDKKVNITIRDNGIGIPESDLTRIFDPGFTTKGVGVGTGLGLSICYQIIQGHRGKIQVESEVGKGTAFTIVLPTNLDKLINSEKE